MSATTWQRASALLAGLLATSLWSCVDPAGRLDDFFAASEPYRATVVQGPCVERVDVSGDFLLSIATVVLPTSPVLFDASFTVDTSAEPWTLTATMQPLAVDGRAAVGAAVTATSDISAEGTFELDFGEITLLGAANPIIPGVDAMATFVLSGCTNGQAFSCGTVDGGITSPATLALTGSTYGAIGVDGDLMTVDPVTTCPE